jgi:hypothetical protein
MSVPDAIAPLTGYRTWALGLGQLWSPRAPGRGRWPRSQPLRAVCLRHGVPSCFNVRIPDHTAPDQRCTCGIYAVFDPWDLEYYEPHNPWTLAAGRVQGGGASALSRAEWAGAFEKLPEESRRLSFRG